MRIVYFTHSLQSCWNHGNAHFLRGVLGELQALGHEVQAFEPRSSWSKENLLRDGGIDALERFAAQFPSLVPSLYGESTDVAAMLDGADLIVVHEWTDPALVGAIGKAKSRGTLLFHDTHHRAVSDPAAIRHFDLSRYDGVLAFGETLAAVYRTWGWGRRVHVWHEAADTRRFQPPSQAANRSGAVWVGNWGDDERTAEIETFLLKPTRDAKLALDIYGVRYPTTARGLLERYGAAYRGWVPNADVPALFAKSLLTVHVPRRYYTTLLPGIPTIRVFEALACGIPLICAPWSDCEQLFSPGEDFLTAGNTDEMTAHMRALRDDPDLASALSARGLKTVLARHTCRHRALELMDIVAGLQTREAA